MSHADRILMGPGPGNPYPEVIEAFGRPVLGHLDPDFIAVLDETNDRLATFTCYDTVNQKWGTERTPPEVVMSMAPKRRSLFRAVNAVNKEYDPEFPASQCEHSAAAPSPSPF